MAALSNFSRNTNENFLEFLGNFVILTQVSSYQIMQKTNAKHFKLLKDNYSVMFKDTGMEFTQILKNKLKKINNADKIHQSYQNAQLPSNVILTYTNLIKNMGDIIEPYLINIIDICLQLYALNPEKSEDQLTNLLTTVSEHISILNSVEKIGRITTFLSKKYLPSTTFGRVNFLLEKVVARSETQEISDSKDQVYSNVHNLLKFMHNFKSEVAEEFVPERSRTIGILVNFSLKCSEKIFKGYFKKLLKWSRLVEDYGEVESDTSDENKMVERKITFVMFLNAFVSKIGRFGINYFGFVFDYYVSFLTYTYTVLEVNPKNNGLGKKRSSSEVAESMSDKQVELHKLILNSLELLFLNDKVTFIDSIKFEKLVKPLAQ